jgi:hypothetical protein
VLSSRPSSDVGTGTKTEGCPGVRSGHNAARTTPGISPRARSRSLGRDAAHRARRPERSRGVSRHEWALGRRGHRHRHGHRHCHGRSHGHSHGLGHRQGPLPQVAQWERCQAPRRSQAPSPLGGNAMGSRHRVRAITRPWESGTGSARARSHGSRAPGPLGREAMGAGHRVRSGARPWEPGTVSARSQGHGSRAPGPLGREAMGAESQARDSTSRARHRRCSEQRSLMSSSLCSSLCLRVFVFVRCVVGLWW